MENWIGAAPGRAAIKELWWERIHLKLRLCLSTQGLDTKGTTPAFYLVNEAHRAGACFEIEAIQGELYTLSLNITNQGEKRCLASGMYVLIVCLGDRMIAQGEIIPELAPRLADCSRTFLYKSQEGMYSIAFYIGKEGSGLPLQIHVVADGVTALGRRRMNKGKQLVKGCMKLAYRILACFYRLIYRRKRTILFFSEQSTVIGTNMAPLKKRLQERGLDREYHILEFYRSVNDHTHAGKLSWLQAIHFLARGNLILIEDHAPILDWLKLRDDTKLIMLWHAGAGYKSSGYSRWGHLDCPAPWSCHRQYTYGISASRKIAYFFSEVWGINVSHVLPTGMPRIDAYLDEGHRRAVCETLRQRYPLIQGKKVILFAPTYRGRDKGDAYYPYEMLDFDKFHRACGEEYVVLFKMHPWVHDPVPIPAHCRDRMLDVGDYPSINDLFYVTDLMISDYSSGIFEYALMRRPMLFFAFDEVQYSLSRGFHRDYRSSTPGKVCTSFDQLICAIVEGDFEFDKVEPYLNYHFDLIDTNSCDRVIDWLILDQMPEEFREKIRVEEDELARRRQLDFS